MLQDQLLQVVESLFMHSLKEKTNSCEYSETINTIFIYSMLKQTSQIIYQVETKRSYFLFSFQAHFYLYIFNTFWHFSFIALAYIYCLQMRTYSDSAE